MWLLLSSVILLPMYGAAAIAAERPAADQARSSALPCRRRGSGPQQPPGLPGSACLPSARSLPCWHAPSRPGNRAARMSQRALGQRRAPHPLPHPAPARHLREWSSAARPSLLSTGSDPAGVLMRQHRPRPMRELHCIDTSLRAAIACPAACRKNECVPRRARPCHRLTRDGRESAPCSAGSGRAQGRL